MNYKIETRILDLVMRNAIDSAIYQATDRFKDRLGDDIVLTQRIARAAAEAAIEQFAAYCNAELRLIQIEHERIADSQMQKTLRLIVPE